MENSLTSSNCWLPLCSLQGRVSPVNKFLKVIPIPKITFLSWIVPVYILILIILSFSNVSFPNSSKSSQCFDSSVSPP